MASSLIPMHSDAVFSDFVIRPASAAITANNEWRCAAGLNTNSDPGGPVFSVAADSLCLGINSLSAETTIHNAIASVRNNCDSYPSAERMLLRDTRERCLPPRGLSDKYTVDRYGHTNLRELETYRT